MPIGRIIEELAKSEIRMTSVKGMVVAGEFIPCGSNFRIDQATGTVKDKVGDAADKVKDVINRD